MLYMFSAVSFFLFRCFLAIPQISFLPPQPSTATACVRFVSRNVFPARLLA